MLALCKWQKWKQQIKVGVAIPNGLNIEDSDTGEVFENKKYPQNSKRENINECTSFSGIRA